MSSVVVTPSLFMGFCAVFAGEDASSTIGLKRSRRSNWPCERAGSTLPLCGRSALIAEQSSQGTALSSTIQMACSVV